MLCSWLNLYPTLNHFWWRCSRSTPRHPRQTTFSRHVSNLMQEEYKCTQTQWNFIIPTCCTSSHGIYQSWSSRTEIRLMIKKTSDLGSDGTKGWISTWYSKWWLFDLGMEKWSIAKCQTTKEGSTITGRSELHQINVDASFLFSFFRLAQCHKWKHISISSPYMDSVLRNILNSLMNKYLKKCFTIKSRNFTSQFNFSTTILQVSCTVMRTFFFFFTWISVFYFHPQERARKVKLIFGEGSTLYNYYNIWNDRN